MTVDSKWIDVDFRDHPPEVGDGWIEQTGDEMCAATPEVEPFSTVFPQHMVSRSQWRDRINAITADTRLIRGPRDSQGQEGACVGFAWKNCLANTIIQRFGRRNWVDLSGVSLYKRIGQTASSGAFIPDGMREVSTRGILPVSSSENIARFQHTHPRTGFNRGLPSGWEATAKQFRASLVATCRGMDEIVSALISLYLGVVGRSRHAINYEGLVVRGSPTTGDILIRYHNSWGPTWSDQGFGYDTLRTADALTMYVILDVVTRPDIVIPEL
jgi:hypothetical protein